MKKVKLAILIFIVVSLTGCMQKYSLTDKQGDEAAEYMAGLLLKYDKNYNDQLLVSDKMTAALIKATKEEENSDAGNTQASPTPVSANTNPDTMNTNAPIPTSKEEQANTEVKQSNSTLTQVINKKDLDIQYKNYRLYDTYPENSDNTNFSLDPGKDNQLLVVTFSVENSSNKKRELNLINSNIGYQLDVNAGTIYKPLLTLLENDLRYIDISLDSGKTKDVILIFEVSKNLNISNANLIASRGSKTNIIKLK